MLKVLREPKSRVVLTDTAVRLEFEVSCSTQDPVTYQWYLNGDRITGEDAHSLDRFVTYWCVLMCVTSAS